jgi:DNA repair photolyase
MEPLTKIVISASRRTDIPAFYMHWMMEQIEKGVFEVINPYNRRVSLVPATPDKVHTIVFWSKNFGPFINGGYGKLLQKEGYHLFFNFTINSNSPFLEPNVPSLEERLEQLDYLCNQFDPITINWRFDPLCFYKIKKERIYDNLHDFQYISKRAACSGIQRCITSFMDHYPKIQKRTTPINGFSFIDPSDEKKEEILLNMEKALRAKKIRLQTCCEKRLLEILPEYSTITKSACIPNDFLEKLFGGNLSLKPDKGQRINDGCGCMVSVDIGSYHLHPCFHNCLFCYANPYNHVPKHPVHSGTLSQNPVFRTSTPMNNSTTLSK